MREYMKFYINGEWVDPITPKSIDVINPATGEVLAVAPRADAAQLDEAVAAAKAAFPAWAALTMAFISCRAGGVS